MAEGNEIGHAPPRGRPVVPDDEANELLSQIANHPIRLGEGLVFTRGPSTCPACGSSEVMWGRDHEQTRSQDEIHPLVWHETEWMADSYICRHCWAGWIEPDEPEPFIWVRPYWRIAT